MTSSVDVIRSGTLAAWLRVSRTRRCRMTDLKVCSEVCTSGVQTAEVAADGRFHRRPKPKVARLTRTPATNESPRSVAELDVPTISLHDLRHTHATLLLKAGVPVKVASERLGHANVAFTMSVYQHVLPGMQAEAAETFAALLATRST